MTVKTVKTPLLSTGRGNNLIEIKQPRRSRNSRGAFLDYRQMGPQQQHQQRPFQTQPQRQLRQRRIEYPPFPSDVLCESCRIIIVRPGALRRSCAALLHRRLQPYGCSLRSELSCHFSQQQPDSFAHVSFIPPQASSPSSAKTLAINLTTSSIHPPLKQPQKNKVQHTVERRRHQAPQ